MVRVRSNGEYSNISVLGLGIIVFASLAVVAIKLCLPRMVCMLHKRIYGNKLRHLAWEADDLHHLQERADRALVIEGIRADGASGGDGTDDVTEDENLSTYSLKRHTAFF